MGKIVWLASYPKSGNTWLRVFLHNYIKQQAEPQDINRLTEFSASEAATAFFRKYEENPGGLTAEGLQRLRPAVHRDLTQLHDDLVFVKTHNAALTLHGIPLCTPSVTAGAIVLVRDPRDVALSYARFTGLSLDQTIAFMNHGQAASRGSATHVLEFLSSWSNHTASWIDSKGRVVLRYEDLLAEPEVGFGKVIAFLGGEAVPARLAGAITRSDFKTLAAQEARDGYRAGGAAAGGRFFRTGQAGQWRGALSDAQIQRIETDHGAMMRRLGYL